MRSHPRSSGWMGVAIGLWPAWALAAFVPRPEVVIDGSASKTGATLADLDGDGHLDLVTETAPIHWGLGDGTFELGTACDYGMPVVGDFDNDGRLDILRVRDEPVLCRGEGDRSFSTAIPVEPSPDAGMHLEGSSIPYAGAAADINGDGWIDVYVSQYEDFNLGKFFADIVYANLEGGSLVVAGQVPRALAGRGVEAGDIDDDGDPDIYVSNYRVRENMLFLNDAGVLAEADERVGAGGAWAHTISSPLGDLDGDGDIDILIGNFAHPGQPSPTVLRNELQTQGRFVEHEGHGIEWVESYASFALADYDNDGDLDLFITTVYDGDFGRLYRNQGDATFEDVTAEMGLAEQTRGYGLALGDLNGDGAIDLVLGGTQPANVYLGEVGDGHWIELTLRGDGKTVNAAAIGARATVDLGERYVVREVKGGGGGGDRGGSPLRLHMGLGALEGSVEVVVRWPWAETCTYEVEVDAHATIQYEPGCDGVEEPGGTDGTSTGPEPPVPADTGTTAAVGGSSTGDGPTTSAAADDGASSAGCGCRSERTAPRPGWLAWLVPWGLWLRRRR